jgi:hypothetical protein
VSNPITTEERQLRLEALRSLEGNLIHQLLLTKLQVLRNNKRREEREAAFSNDTNKAFGCEWALWGLEQMEEVLAKIKIETIGRPEKSIKY